jgi:hypothetical protein
MRPLRPAAQVTRLLREWQGGDRDAKGWLYRALTKAAPQPPV